VPDNPASDPDGSDPLDDLLDGDAQPLRAWLGAAGVDYEELWRLPRWNVAGDPMPYRRIPEDLPQRVDAVLAEAVELAALQPGGIARLFAYLHYECDRTWDVSYHFAPIWATLRGACAAWVTRRPVSDPAEVAGAEAFLALLVVLDLEIQVENAMTCGLVREAGRLSRQAAEQAKVAAGLADALTLQDPGVAGYVGEWGHGCAVYDEAFAVAAYALADLLDGTGDSVGAAIDALRAGEDELGAGPGEADTDDASELRGHRYSLEDVQATRDKPWLYVDTARVVYVYPFALRLDPAEAVLAAAEGAEHWRLADTTPTAVHEGFNLDDVWHSSDSDGRRFDGVQVLLPEVTLRGPARLRGDDPVLTTLRAELRLSWLGNHYLRFEGELVDADPQEVYAALMRAAPEHGRLDVTCGAGGQHWHRLADLAIDVIEEASQALNTSMSARPGMFQVLLTVYAASVGTGPAAVDRVPVRTPEQVTGAVGAAVLFRPVPNMINTLAEWVRYPPPAREEAIAGATNLRDHLVLRTCNTTVQVAFGLAHWSLDTSGNIAEFAASLEGLFAGWFDELGEYQKRVREMREASESETAEALRLRVRQLREEQIRLHKLITEARSTLALIVSPALVSSPVVAEQLVTMVEAAGTPRRAVDLSRRAEEVLDERLGRSIETLARQRAELEAADNRRSEERQRARLNAILAIVAAVGFSGLGQIVQAGYEWKGWSHTWGIIAVIVALALLVGGVAWLLSDRSPVRRLPQGSADSQLPPGSADSRLPRGGADRQLPSGSADPATKRGPAPEKGDRGATGPG
jgi:hypothetical protein